MYIFGSSATSNHNKCFRAREVVSAKELKGVVLVVPVALVSSENNVDGLTGVAFEIQHGTSEVWMASDTSLHR